MGSRNPTKLGLLVDFGYYTTGQTFLGLKTLVLDNIWQDPSMLREHMAMALFARMGEPASRESYARLYINNVFQGVYALVEDVDTNYLSRTFGEGGGYLFEYHWMDEFRANDLGDDLAAYKLRFEPRTHEKEADTVLWGPIRDFFREVNNPVDAVWRSRVEQYVDLQQFIRFVAIEVFLSEGDGVTGYAGMNNFYFYRPLGTNQHKWIVWDRDLCMLQVDSSIFLRTDENVLFRNAMAFSDLRTLYLDTLEQCAMSALEDGWFETEALQTSSLIANAAYEDTRKDFSNDTYDVDTARIISFTQLRPAFVLQEVARARASSAEASATGQQQWQ